MGFPLTWIDLAGTVALLLWSVRMVQTGVQRAFGPDLRRLLSGALRGRLAGFAAGLGVTAVLQSSTATGLMVAGFTSAGLVALLLGPPKRSVPQCRGRGDASPFRPAARARLSQDQGAEPPGPSSI